MGLRMKAELERDTRSARLKTKSSTPHLWAVAVLFEIWLCISLRRDCGRNQKSNNINEPSFDICKFVANMIQSSQIKIATLTVLQTDFDYINRT